jgi:hypothetical protein
MKSKKELLEIRNERIYKRYKELYDIQFLRNEKVCELLSDEFYILPDAISKIVFGFKKKSRALISDSK